MKLEDLFNRSNLKILEAATGEVFTVNTLQTYFFDKKESKSLIFAYLDNSIESLSFLISSFCSQHSVALFSNDLSIDLKTRLERSYSPQYIFDSKRETIPNYNYTSANYFELVETYNLEIDINIKVLLSTSGTTGSPSIS